jgi:hypothetical protein
VSLDAQDWVWDHSHSKGTARLVLLAIADKANGPDHSAYAGTALLVQRSNAARSSVIVAVDKLLASGELEEIKDRKGPHGETCYRLPLAVGHRRKGGPKSGPVRNPDRSENRTPGGPDSVPGGSGFRTPTGPDSGPQNTENASERSGTQRESARPNPKPRPAGGSSPALSLIPQDWQPAPEDFAAARADIDRLGTPAAKDATAKFVRHHQAKGDTATNWGPLWVTWLARERPPAAAPTQGALLMAFPGGAERTTTRRSTTDERVAQALAVAAELRALEEGNTA